MAQPTQCSSGGQAIGRLVGNPGRTPTIGQKRLRGKNGKSCHGRQYKKPQTCTVKQEQGGKRKESEAGRKKKENRENEGKKERTQKTKSNEQKYE